MSTALPEPLTPVELFLLRAVESPSATHVVIGPEYPGEVPDGDESLRNVIRADVLEALLFRGTRDGHRDRQFTVRRAEIRGSLNWAHTRRVPPLEFAGCRFTDPVCLRNSRTSSLTFSDGSLPYLDLTEAQVGGPMRLLRMRIGEPSANGSSRKVGVSVKNATIRGDLVCTGTRLRGRQGRPALQGESVHVDGDLCLNRGFRCGGGIQLRGARVRGHLDLNGARVVGRRGPALNVDLGRVEGNVTLKRGRFRGAVVLKGTVVRGSLLATEGTFRCRRRNGVALKLDGASIQATWRWTA